jgi:hypothetical protein
MDKKRPSTVGSLVLACNTGLGILARDFYDNGIVDKVVVMPHARYGQEESWYRKEDRYYDLQTFVQDIDVLLCFEVPNPGSTLDWNLVSICKAAGKKVVLMPMYESTPFPIPEHLLPDVWVFPSELDKDFYNERGITGILARVPVNVRSRQRKTVKRFIHNAGSRGSQSLDRNGTELLINALPFIDKDVDITIRSRDTDFRIEDDRVTTVLGDVPYADLWEEGDAFIFVESFNGLSLPLQEAYAAGMLVIAGDRFPINTWLPKEALVKPEKTENIRYVFDVIPKTSYESINLAKMINYWNGKDISEYSSKGIRWGEDNSWSNLKDHYVEIIK